MANTWNVSPSEGVTNNNDGTFVFPENTGTTDIEYIVTYSSDTCNCTCEKKVVIKGEECNCTISSSSSESEPITDEPGASLIVVGTINGCNNTSFAYISGDANFVRDFDVNENNEIIAHVDANDGQKRHAVYSAACDTSNSLYVWQAATSGCKINWTVYPGYSTTCNTCDCSADDFSLTVSSIDNIPVEGNTYTIGNVEDCIDLIASPEDWRGSFVRDNNNELKIIVPANETDSTITETITFTYSDRCGHEFGTSGLTLNQEKANSCVDLEITSSSVEFNSDGGSISVGTISGSHTIVKTSDSPSWITVNNTSGNVKLSANASTESRNGVVTFKVDDDICSEQKVTVNQTVPVSVIKYSGTSKVNVNLSDFTPAATAETFSNGVGKIEFAEVVTAISEKAFSGKSAMTGIDIPNTITSIGNSAFTNCNSLTSITIPSSVGSINNYLLYNCTSLSSVTLESETLQLKPYSISNCPNLRKIEMTSVTACPSDYQYALENSADCPIYVPEQYLDKFWNGSFSYTDRVISHIGDNCVVYKANSKLTGPNLGNAYSDIGNVEANKLTIQSHTFDTTKMIGKIKYSGTIVSFHDNTFDTLEEIYIILPEKLKVIGQEVFISNYYLKSIFIPDSVVRLGKYAEAEGCETFYNCTGLKRLVAGSGLTSIGAQCFAASSPAYTGFTFYSTSAPTLYHRNTFEHTGSCSIYVPCGKVNSYKTSNIWNDSTISTRIKAIPPCTS